MGWRVSRGRLEAFSDGVIAVVITIMVAQLATTPGHALTDLRPLGPKLAVYLLSFVFIAIYWNNHHHLLHAVERHYVTRDVVLHHHACVTSWCRNHRKPGSHRLEDGIRKTFVVGCHKQ